MKKQWKKIVPVVLGGSFLCGPFAEAATELTDKIYTNNIDPITSGSYSVSKGDVLLDASGYTGLPAYESSIINTMNGAVNININDGKTLTIKGYNNNPRPLNYHQGSALYAYQRGTLSGTMTFTGGNLIVSNEVTRTSHSSVFGLFADTGGKFDFKSDGDNKINLTVLVPMVGSMTADRHGIGLHNGELAFDGGNFLVKVDGDSVGSVNRRIGIEMAAGSNLDIKADNIWIEANEHALFIPATSGSYNPVARDVTNTAKFAADSIVLKGGTGITSTLETKFYKTKNFIEFTGETLIDAAVEGDSVFADIDGGRAIDVMATNITFNNKTALLSENLTDLGTAPGYKHPVTGNWIDGYSLKAVSLEDSSTLVANDDLSISSNGGYNNTGLHVLKSLAQFNGKTDITMKNGVDSTKAVYVTSGANAVSKAEFNDDLAISLAGTRADYIAGIETASGGKVEVKKGLILNDNSDIYWAISSRGAKSQVDVNTSASGTVQVIGDIGAVNGGSIYMNLNNENSYLTATSYTSTSGATSKGKVNLDISNGAVWNMTGSSSVTNLNLADQGRVNFMPPEDGGAFKTLTVDGNYDSNGGALYMNTVLADDDADTDKLIVKGNTSGETDLFVNNIGGGGVLTTDGIEIIQVAGQSDGMFTLKNRAVAGAYEYFLHKNKPDEENGSWYLRSELTPEPPITEPPVVIPPTVIVPPVVTPPPRPESKPDPIYRPEAGSYMANMAAANTLFNLRLEDREGRAENSSMWLRQVGSHTKFRDNSGQLRTSTNRYVIQGGGELFNTAFTASDRLGIGMMFGYGKADSHTDSTKSGYSSKGEVDGYSAGLYATWYQDANTLNGLYLDSWINYSWLDAQVNGEKLASESYDINGYSASLETGYRLPVYQGENGHVFITPQAQIIWNGLKADDHTESNGTRVKSGGSDNLQTRLGLKVSRDGVSDRDKGNDKLFTVYAEANWIYNSKQSDAYTSMDDVKVNMAGTRNVGELKLGTEGQLNKRLSLWSNVAQQLGGDGYSDTSVNLGIKYQF